MADVTVLRAVLEADDSQLDTVLRRADKNIRDWASASRTAPRLNFTDNTGAVRTRVNELDRDLDRITKKARRLDIAGNIPKNFARDLKDVADTLPKLKSTTATVTLNREGNLDLRELRMVDRMVSRLDSKTITIRTNYEQTGTAPIHPLNRPAISAPVPRRSGFDFREMGQAGNVLTAGVTAPLVAGGALALRAGIQWESAFTGVRKTVAGTTGDLRQLELQLRDMAAGKNAIPIKANELAQVAESAGELGIATPNIANFTKTMAQMGASTNLSSNEAAQDLARLDNIMASGQKSFDRYGAAIVALGNDGASTEKEIVNMALRIAGAGKQIGLSESNVLGFASALASAGISAESGGSSISSVLLKIDAAARDGGDKLNTLAKVAGMSATQFRKAWRDDAAGATVAFVQGLGKVQEAGGSATATLKELGMNEIRQRDAMLRLSNAGDLLASSLRTSEGAWQQNTALATEAGKRYATTASQLQILENRATEAALKVSQIVLPDINKDIKQFSDGLPETVNKILAGYEALGDGGRKAALGGLAIAASAGPMLKAADSAATVATTIQGITQAAREAKIAQAAIVGAGALEGAGGIAAGAGLLSNPVGLIILAGALTAGLVLLTKFKNEYDDILARNQQLTQASEQLKTSFASAIAGAPDSKAQRQLEKLRQEATDAKGDTEKLKKALQDVRDQDVHIQKLGLAPHAEDPLRHDLAGIIASLETQLSINLRVNAAGAPNAGGGANGFTPPRYAVSTGNGSWRKPTTREEIKAMASAAGLVVEAPQMVQQTNLGPLPLTGAQERMAKYRQAQARGLALPPELKDPREGLYWWQRADPAEVTKYENGKAAYQAQLEAIRKKLAPMAHAGEQRSEALSHGNYWARLDNGLKKYHNDLEKLLALQKLYDDARKNGYRPSDDEKKAVSAVNNRVKELEAQGHAKRNHEKYMANRAKADADAEAQRQAEAAAKLAQQRAEAQADQARADRGQDLGKRFQQWNGFGNGIEAQMGRLAQSSTKLAGVDDLNRQLAETTERARLAHDEFDGIPQSVKNWAIELAGVNAELQQILALKNGIEKPLQSSYNNTDARGKRLIVELATNLEQGLNLDKRANELMARGQQLGANALSVVQSNKDTLQSQIRANQLAGRKGYDDSKDPTDGIPIAGKVSAAQVVQAAQDAASGAQPKFSQTCAWAVTKMYESMGVEVKSQNNNGAKSLVDYARKYWRQVDAAIAPPGALLAEPSASANSGWHVSMSRGGRARAGSNNHKLQLGSMGSSAIAFVPPQIDPLRQSAESPIPKVLPTDKGGSLIMPTSTAPRFPAPSQVVAPKRPSATATASANPGALAGARAGALLAQMMAKGNAAPALSAQPAKKAFLDLPKGWGVPMAEYQPKPGEQTAMRQLQENSFLEILAKGQKIPDAVAKRQRQLAAAADINNSIRAGDAAIERELEESSARIRVAAGKNNPVAVLLEQFASDARRFSSPQAKNKLVAGTLAEMRAEFEAKQREFSNQSLNNRRMAGENAGMLSGDNFDAAGYARAQFATKSRFDFQNDPETLKRTQAIKSLRDGGFALQADTLQRQVNEAAIRHQSDALMEYEAQLVQSIDEGHAKRLQAMRDENDLLEYQTKLTRDLTLSQDERDARFEGEKARRAEAKELEGKAVVEGGKGGSVLEQYAVGKVSAATVAGEAAQVGDAVAGKVRREQTDRKGKADTAESGAHYDNMETLRRQLEIARTYGQGDPQAAIESQLASERQSIIASMAGQIPRDAEGKPDTSGVKEEIERRLSLKRAELELQRDINRTEEEGNRVLDLQNSALEEQFGRAQATARTAQEHLRIQLLLEQAKRDTDKRHPETPAEQAAREKLDDQRKESAAQEDRMARYHAEAQTAAEIWSNAMNDGLNNGLGSFFPSLTKGIAEAVKRGLINETVNNLFGQGDPNAPHVGGILDILIGRSNGGEAKRKNPLIPDNIQWGPKDGGNPAPTLPRDTGSLTSPVTMMEQMYARISGQLSNPNPVPIHAGDASVLQGGGGGGIGAQIAQAIQGGISAASVSIQAVSTEVRGQTVNVSGGGGFMPTSARPLGGGAGTRSLLNEILGG